VIADIAPGPVVVIVSVIVVGSVIVVVTMLRAVRMQMNSSHG
jgi:hypothetical protein